LQLTTDSRAKVAPEPDYDHVLSGLARVWQGHAPIVSCPGLWDLGAAFGMPEMDDIALQKDELKLAPERVILPLLGARSIVLVGMMGAGKSSIGRKLAARLGIPFVDADAEIEAAADMSITEIFASKGEAYFRDGEKRVIARLLEGAPQVLATGGGAFINPETRALIGVKGVSVWLKAEFDVLMRRIRRRADRPLLRTAHPAETLRMLISERYPVYEQADVVIQSRDVPHETIVAEILAALAEKLGHAAADNAAVTGGTP
jgi:shikimate kinase